MLEKCGEYDKAMTYPIWVCCAPRKGKLDFTASSFSSTIYSSLSTTRPRISAQHIMSAINPETPSHRSFNYDTYTWLGEGKVARRGKGNSFLVQSKMVMCFASESFILFLPSSLLSQLDGFI